MKIASVEIGKSILIFYQRFIYLFQYTEKRELIPSLVDADKYLVL